MVEKLCSYHHFPPDHIIHFPLAMDVTQWLESFNFFCCLFVFTLLFFSCFKANSKGKRHRWTSLWLRNLRRHKLRALGTYLPTSCPKGHSSCKAHPSLWLLTPVPLPEEDQSGWIIKVKARDSSCGKRLGKSHVFAPYCVRNKRGIVHEGWECPVSHYWNVWSWKRRRSPCTKDKSC